MRQPGNAFGGGKLGGTPISSDRFPFSPRMSQTAGSWIEPGRRDRQAVVRVVLAVAEPVDAELPGVFPVIAHAQAGTVIGGVMLARSPCIPLVHELADVGDLVDEVAEQELRGAAVEPDHGDPGSLLHAEHPLRFRGLEAEAGVTAHGGASAVRVSYQAARTPTELRR